MKKIVCLVLCVLFCTMLLASCASQEIGADLPEYLEKFAVEERQSMEFDFYIIVGEGTTDHSITTVKRMINSHLSDEFKSTLDIHFLTADEYVEATLAAVDASGKDRADIVLVAGKEMFDELVNDKEEKKLIELNSYFASKDFGRLNSNQMIATSLLESSVFVHTYKDEATGKDVTARIKYVVPNNRVVGGYDYVMVHRATAEFLNFSPEKIKSMTSLDNEYLLQLQSALATNRDALLGAGYNPDECIVYIENGLYQDRDAYVKNGYECVVSSYPIVSAEEAHESSFAIVKQDSWLREKEAEEHYYRCMEIIYAINSDVYLRNLLQYGVEVSNYVVNEDGSVTPVTEGEGVYNMDAMYTGPIFNAYYSDSYGWNEAVATAGKAQNDESKSVYAVAP